MNYVQELETALERFQQYFNKDKGSIMAITSRIEELRAQRAELEGSVASMKASLESSREDRKRIDAENDGKLESVRVLEHDTEVRCAALHKAANLAKSEAEESRNQANKTLEDAGKLKASWEKKNEQLKAIVE